MTKEFSGFPHRTGLHRKFRLTAIVFSLAMLGYFTASSAGLGRKDAPAKRPGGSAIPVSTAAALRGDISVYLDGLGTVTPLQSVTVRSRVDGELVAIHFSEGQPVKKGELLAEIDPRPFQTQLAQAEGQLARDQALLENSRADLQRYQTLLQQDSIASQQVTGQAALVKQHQAAVAVDQGQIAAIKLQLSYCRITSPVSGRAGLRLVDPGNIVRANDAGGLVVISQVQPIAAVFTLPEDKLPAVMAQLRGNQTVTTDAYDRSGSNRLAVGKLLAVDNQIDPATGTVKLKAVFPNDDGTLFANQFVNVRMNLEPLRGTTIIPASAVQRGSPGDFAYVVAAENKVKLQTLKLGPRDGERIAVLEGLAAGDQVVVEGTDRLREGSVVQVIAADEKLP
ncbi:MAG: MdtA/MuxA family multidrug efflux RND transporter periplasmic adaptor subunit, partial [Methylococcaceae bacterium]|nr:MdtA/MuxA family multidrug efflux RND transporter periplasmic adaptor subunit [Methylococcaceae bacterium]